MRIALIIVVFGMSLIAFPLSESCAKSPQMKRHVHHLTSHVGSRYRQTEHRSEPASIPLRFGSARWWDERQGGGGGSGGGGGGMWSRWMVAAI